ncbi:hypothetical protein SDC9_58306 [bioreactor metagenome]|jgi:hypothetical protein|uniref:Uncharacterized protein n=1 Tax=bioreactor metagenome TaxID=1076179 RepID=A0A644X723_9ZZZZ
MLEDMVQVSLLGNRKCPNYEDLIIAMYLTLALLRRFEG